MKDGQAQALKSSFLHDEVAYSITGRKDEIWIGTQRSGLKRFEYRNEVTGGKDVYASKWSGRKTACLRCIKARMGQCGPEP